MFQCFGPMSDSTELGHQLSRLKHGGFKASKKIKKS